VEKPIVFLSHSSKDAASLKRLRQLLSSKTDGFIDFFLSSDGESIPFGRNWVGTIQDALQKAKIMFVFLSPRSITSSWVYFESGFTYSKGIRVIPLGILGVELGKVPPPLSLLQGFNVTSHESLNNILRIFNDEFDTTFKDTFTETEFSEVFVDAAWGLQEFGAYASLINSIIFRGSSGQKVCPMLRDAFSKKGLVVQYSELGRDETLRAWFSSNGIDACDNTKGKDSAITCSAELAFLTFPLIEEALTQANAKRPISGDVEMHPEAVQCVHEKFKITSRIYGTAISLNPDGKFVFKGYTFQVHRSTSGFSVQGLRTAGSGVTITFECQTLVSSHLGELVKILFDREILFVSQMIE